MGPNSILVEAILTKMAGLLQVDEAVYEANLPLVEKVQESWPLSRWAEQMLLQSRRKGLAGVEQHFSIREAEAFLESRNAALVLFRTDEKGQIYPVIVMRQNGALVEWRYDVQVHEWMCRTLEGMEGFAAPPTATGSTDVLAVTFFPFISLAQTPDKAPPLSPWQRLWRLLSGERKVVTYIYVYAILSGLVALSLPLGIQASFRFISSGTMTTSLFVVVLLLLVGLGIAGLLQIMQLWLVEILQQRVFARGAFEFAIRIPRIDIRSLRQHYPPELMNRFMDVVALQKELPKLLVDISAAVLQVLFGLVLLTIYHPYFLSFVLFSFLFVSLLFYYTFERGLHTSIKESGFKYKIQFWLEELGRAVRLFRLSPNSRLPLLKMDELVNKYLYFRNQHFRVLVRQHAFILLFKLLTIGGLLLLGGALVQARQFSLGQLVASEVLVILVVGAIEKAVIGLPTIYHVLTSLEKIGQVTDLPLVDHRHKLPFNSSGRDRGVAIRMQGVAAWYISGKPALRGIDLEVAPGEKICLSGPESSGKHTLMRLLIGYARYEGLVQVNGVALRDLDLDSWRMHVSSDFPGFETFSGTILENISLGKPTVSIEDVYWAMDAVCLADAVGHLPDGLHTVLDATGRPLSLSEREKLVLARCIVSRPRLILLFGRYPHIAPAERRRIMDYLMSADRPWNLIVLSNEPWVQRAADRVVVLKGGRIVASGPYAQMQEHLSDL